MVLQRGIPVPLWGTAAECEKVIVRFQGQEVRSTARNGKWLVRLRDLQPGGLLRDDHRRDEHPPRVSEEPGWLEVLDDTSSAGGLLIQHLSLENSLPPG